MEEARKTRGSRSIRRNERGSLSPKVAILGLVAVVVVVGAVGYVGLNAVGTGTSHTIRTCAPASSVQCKKAGNLTGEFVAEVPSLGAA
jgi:uncharacterized protein (UPF0333 family)